MKFEKGSEYGIVFDDNNVIRGLWFLDANSAQVPMRIRAILGLQNARYGRTVIDSDYLAATMGTLPVTPGLEPHGGVFMFFPSAQPT